MAHVTTPGVEAGEMKLEDSKKKAQRCTTCSGVVAQQALKCPHCGQPFGSPGTGVWVTFGILFAIAAPFTYGATILGLIISIAASQIVRRLSGYR